MIVLYSIVALFVSLVWINYFRMVSVFSKLDYKAIFIFLCLGGLSVFVVFFVNGYFLDKFSFELNGEYLNDFLFYTFEVGLLEEFSKALPVLLALIFYKKVFKEPFDYILYIAVSSLGFSGVENVLYFDLYGSDIIVGRSILASISHMFDSTAFGYGILMWQLKQSNYVFKSIAFIIFSFVSHGVYDLSVSMPFIWTLFYYFLTVSVFITMLNNTLNNSSFFTYKKAINSGLVTKTLAYSYLIVLILQFVLLVFLESISMAFILVFSSSFIFIFILTVVLVRLSRFTLIDKKWHSIKVELPFTIFSKFRIRGESYNEYYISNYFQEPILISPFPNKKVILNYSRDAVIHEKVFEKTDSNYSILIDDLPCEINQRFLIKAKERGKSFINGKYPIIGLYFDNDKSKPKFIEWAFLISKSEVESKN